MQQATALDPNNQRAFNNLGLAYAKAGNANKAALAFAEAITVEKPVNTTAIVAEPAQSAPTTVTNIAAVPDSSASVETAPQQDAQMLAIPKDRGIIRAAEAAPPVIPVVESRTQLVQVAPNVSELQLRPQITESLQFASIEDQQELQKIRLEVSNGNGVTGAAGKVSKFLRGQGYAATRLTNQKPFKTQTTYIQYRPGYEVQAQYLQSRLLDAPELVERNDMRANVSVRLVLGKDMVTQLAHYEYETRAHQLALNISKGKSSVKQLF